MKRGLLFSPSKAVSLGGSEDSVSLRAPQLSRLSGGDGSKSLPPLPLPFLALALWLPAAGSVVLASRLPRSS